VGDPRARRARGVTLRDPALHRLRATPSREAAFTPPRSITRERSRSRPECPLSWSARGWWSGRGWT